MPAPRVTVSSCKPKSKGADSPLMTEHEQVAHRTARLVASGSFVALLEDPEGQPPVEAHLEHTHEDLSEAETLSAK